MSRTDLADRLPNFFVIGAYKAGTTSLYRYLAQHRDVFLPKVKEPSFFSDEAAYGRGLNAYTAWHYKRSEGAIARGDATPAYLPSLAAPIRIAESLPETSHRFVAILRDPVERAYSMYWNLVRTGIETGTFEEGLGREAELLARPETEQLGAYTTCYVHCGRYAESLKRYIETFGRQRVLILFYEDLLLHPRALIDEVFNFLELPKSDDIEIEERHNAASAARFPWLNDVRRLPPWVKAPVYRLVPRPVSLRLFQFVDAKNRRPFAYPPVNPETDRAMRSLFDTDIAELEALTCRRLSHWRRPPEDT